MAIKLIIKYLRLLILLKFEVILTFASRLFTILDGVFRTMMVAGVAGVAVAVPMRMTVFHGDVLQRANLGAQTARDAVVVGKKRLVGSPFVEA